MYSTPDSTGLDAALSPDTATPLVDDPALTETIATVDANRHTLVENVMGVVTGVFLASFGLYLLKESGSVSGGTAGLALLLSYATHISFGVLFFAVNIPFFALALWKKGLAFTLRTTLTVALVSAFSYLHPSPSRSTASTPSTAPSAATSSSASACSSSSATVRASAASTSSPSCCRSDSAGGPGTSRWPSTSSSSPCR